METTFYITIHIKTPKGYENFARFYIGDLKESALSLFASLKGRTTAISESPLQIDLVETRNLLPVNIQVLGCTLDELADNCKIITRELFKMIALGGID